MTIDLNRQLQHFHQEQSTAAHAFFLWKGVNNCAAEDEEIRKGLNEQALSWNTITHSLQTTFFIALGRLFDTDGEAFSVHTLLRNCIENLDQFSKDALRARKMESTNGKEPDWLKKYIDEAYVPSEKDFQRLRGEVSKRQKQYEEIYRPIRNEVFAHRDAASMDNVEELFGKTRVDEIEVLLSFLYQIQEVIFQLLRNGELRKIGDFEYSEEEHVVDDIRALLVQLRLKSSLCS